MAPPLHLPAGKEACPFAGEPGHLRRVFGRLVDPRRGWDALPRAQIPAASHERAEEGSPREGVVFSTREEVEEAYLLANQFECCKADEKHRRRDRRGPWANHGGEKDAERGDNREGSFRTRGHAASLVSRLFLVTSILAKFGRYGRGEMVILGYNKGGNRRASAKDAEENRQGHHREFLGSPWNGPGQKQPVERRPPTASRTARPGERPLS